NRELWSPRNQYPLLIPLDAATIMSLAADSDDHQVRFLYLGIFAALAFHLRNRLAQLIEPRVAAWCAALFVWIPQFAIGDAGGALTAYNDIAVAAFVGCAFFELMEGERPLMFGLWLAFLALTKSEGLPLAIILAAIGAFPERGRPARWIARVSRAGSPGGETPPNQRARRPRSVALAPIAVAAIPLTAWRSGIPHTEQEPFPSRP